MQYVAGIESTAHTFSVSIVSAEGRILSDSRNVYRAPEGSGIHPFEASRSHLAAAPSVVKNALERSGVSAGRLAAICYSMGPGLGPCLRVGAVVSRTLAVSLSKPLVPVNHAVGHIELGCMLTGSADPLVLLVSGGHTMVVAQSGGRWRVLGETLDLTLGQLLDQFGRHTGLSSPCGRAIEEGASRSSTYLRLPYTVKGNDVSFSGMLTAAKNLYDDGSPFEDVCFSLQETAFGMMVEATERALAFTEKRDVVIVGGVAANKRLSHMMTTMTARHSARFSAVPVEYSGDCGAQIAWTGYLAFRSGVIVRPEDALVRQSWRLDSVDIPWRS